MGCDVTSHDDLVSGRQQLLLLKRLGNEDAGSQRVDSVLDALKSATTLGEFDDLLTRAMAERRIQSLIRGDNLDLIVGWILDLNRAGDEELRAAAMLGRLSAVTRGERVSRVNAGIAGVFSGEPPSIETLPDGEAKTYAALALSQIEEIWLPQYAVREAVLIDRADDARRELLSDCLRRAGSLAKWISAISDQASCLQPIARPESRSRRIRRLFSSMDMVAQRWRGEVGLDVGSRIGECLRSFLASLKVADLDESILFESSDSLMSLLGRVIELRFSSALYADTYRVLPQAKLTLGPSIWGRFVRASGAIASIRTSLLEASLVLARQNRTDDELRTMLATAFLSRSQASAAIRRHFKGVQDLDPNIEEWWTTGKEATQPRLIGEHNFGNSEDVQIGALLIEVERNRIAIEKIGRAVIPLLEISDEILASTAKRAVGGQHTIEQTARRLGRMRRLRITDLVGKYAEYNPLEHELVGGHRAGIRRVKVVREGVRKEFGGRVRTLVKPWVEAEDE